MPLNYALKNDENGAFCIVYFTTVFKIFNLKKATAVGVPGYER